jgi:hypothetical protein
MPGWPVTIDLAETYGRRAAAHLPTLNVTGVADPVVQIVDEANGEIVYTVRMAGQSWRPPVFAPGTYTVKVSDPEQGKETVVQRVTAGAGGPATLDVRV